MTGMQAMASFAPSLRWTAECCLIALLVKGIRDRVCDGVGARPWYL